MRGWWSGQRDHHRAPLTAALLRRPTTAARTRLVSSVLVLLATATTFLPWGSSGEATRSSHQIVAVAERAGVVPDGWGWATVVWTLVPALCGVVLLAASARWTRTVGVATTTIGAVIVAGGLLVTRSPLLAEAGVDVAMLVGALSMIAGAVTTAAGSTTTPEGGLE